MLSMWSLVDCACHCVFFVQEPQVLGLTARTAEREASREAAAKAMWAGPTIGAQDADEFPSPHPRCLHQ